MVEEGRRGGECLAMLWLGSAYECGDGVEKDDCKAKEYWERSHAAGCLEATEKLLSLADVYREEAVAGDASAQFFMGAALEYGYGTERNTGEAIGWYRKAAEQGHPGAQAFLGYALLAGEGMEKNAEEAVEWYRKAAKQEEAGTMFNLGACHKDGTASPKTSSRQWLGSGGRRPWAIPARPRSWSNGHEPAIGGGDGDGDFSSRGPGSRSLAEEGVERLTQ